MSAFHPKADIVARRRHVRFVPKADMRLIAIAAISGFESSLRKDGPVFLGPDPLAGWPLFFGQKPLVAVVSHGVIRVADYPFSPTSDLPHQWVGNSATGKSAAERRGRSLGW
jgi:hypothetical protein